MKNRRPFELRNGSQKWAVLWVSDHEKILEHELTALDVSICPGVVLYDEGEQPLNAKQYGQYLMIRSGAVYQFRCNYHGRDVTDVIDPSGKVDLVFNLAGGVFNFRWLRQ